MARLLDGLREAGAHEQAAALPARAATHVPLDNLAGVARLLERLREAGAHEQAAALLARDPRHPSTARPGMHDGQPVGGGGAQRAAALASRDADQAVRNPGGWPACGRRRARRPRRPGAVADCWTACGRRARTSRPPRWRPVTAAHATLDSPGAVAELLASLRAAGAHEQATTLASRLPAAGMFRLFLEQQGSADQFRFGREADGTSAAPWGWEDLDLWLVPGRGQAAPAQH